MIRSHMGSNTRQLCISAAVRSGAVRACGMRPHALMVIAWLSTCRAFFRKWETQELPFRHERVRRRVSTQHHSLDLAGEVAQAPAQTLALAELEPDFQYDHLRVLDDAARAQYHHWTAAGVRSEDLWFFKVVNIQSLPEPLPLGTYSSRQVSQTFQVLDETAAQLLIVELVHHGDWLPEGSLPRLVMCLSGAASTLFQIAALKSIAMPSPYSTGSFATPTWFKKMLSPALQQVFGQTAAAAHQHCMAVGNYTAFQLTDAEMMADELRRALQGQAREAELVRWVLRLQRQADALQQSPLAHKHRHRWSQTAMINYLMLSELLKSADKLRQAITKACEISMPVDVFQAVVSHNSSAPPDQASLCRFKLTLDVGMMIYQRAANMQNMLGGQRHFRFLTWDSSPQYHKDYELAVVESVKDTDMPDVMATFANLAAEAAQESDADLAEDADLQEQHMKLMNHIRKKLHRHALPCALVGFGAASFPHKRATLLHSLQ